MSISPLYQVDQAMNVFNNSINGIAALIQGKEVTWSDKGISYSLNQTFDKAENYEDKFAEGNICGGYLNFEGEVLGLPKAIVLNAYNNYDSLVSGHGLQGWMRKMDFLNCENEYFERRGERALSEKILEENQYIGIGYILVMEILTDPLTFAGGEIAAAKGVSEIGSLRYMEELKNGATIYTKTYEAEKLAKAANVVDDIAKKGVQYENIDDIAKVDNVIEGGNKTGVLFSEEAEEIAFNAIKGKNNADGVVLGKFGDGGPTAYTNVAESMDAQYFQLDNWDELASKYSDDEIWKINENFLDIQTSSGREIYLSHNPYNYVGDGSFYSKEIQYLLDSGYRFVREGDVWHAVR